MKKISSYKLLLLGKRLNFFIQISEPKFHYHSNFANFSDKIKAKIFKENENNITNEKELIQDKLKEKNDLELEKTKKESKIKNFEYLTSRNFYSQSNEDIKLNADIAEKNTLVSNISDKIFKSLINDEDNAKGKDEKGSSKLQHDKDLITFSSTSLDCSNNKTQYMLNIDRTLNFKENKVFQDLIINNKLDLTDNKIRISSLKLESEYILDEEEKVSYDGDINTSTTAESSKPIQIIQADIGNIKSFPKLNENLNLTQEQLDLLSKNENYEYEISLIGRKVSKEELKDKRNLNLDEYLRLNQNQDESEQTASSESKIHEIQHFISPIIFHDEETKENVKVDLKQSIISYMLRNPLIIFAFLVVGFYVYPLLWKKEYFMNLSEDYNNKRILENYDNIYDYINYRRGLYVSVRSNFS